MSNKLNSFKDVELYLSNKQVYFKKEITDSDFKTIAKAGLVHNIGDVELHEINKGQIQFTLFIDNNEVILYEYKLENEFLDWIEVNFIPIQEMLNRWYS